MTYANISIPYFPAAAANAYIIVLISVSTIAFGFTKFAGSNPLLDGAKGVCPAISIVACLPQWTS